MHRHLWKKKRDADANLDAVKQSIQSAQSIISDCVSDLENNRYCTADVKNGVKEQLGKVSTGFYSICRKACTDVADKYNKTNNIQYRSF